MVESGKSSHFKEEGGKDGMCEAVENYAKEYAKEYAESIIAEKEKIEAENKELREKLARYEKEQK